MKAKNLVGLLAPGIIGGALVASAINRCDEARVQKMQSAQHDIFYRPSAQALTEYLNKTACLDDSKATYRDAKNFLKGTSVEMPELDENLPLVIYVTDLPLGESLKPSVVETNGKVFLNMDTRWGEYLEARLFNEYRDVYSDMGSGYP
jgi:hypothetical protein